jgi:hypothetical protein
LGQSYGGGVGGGGEGWWKLLQTHMNDSKQIKYCYIIFAVNINQAYFGHDSQQSKTNRKAIEERPII